MKTQRNPDMCGHLLLQTIENSDVIVQKLPTHMPCYHCSSVNFSSMHV